jgi:hypothetical protein
LPDSNIKKISRFSANLSLLLHVQYKFIISEQWDQADSVARPIRKITHSIERLSQSLQKNNNKALSEFLPPLTWKRLKSCIRINKEIESAFESEAHKASKELFKYKADLALLKLRESEDLRSKER